MKTARRTILAIVGGATSAFAAGGAATEGSGLLATLFVGFGVCILVFQLIPAAILFVSTIRGLFTATEEKALVPTEKHL